MYDQGYVNGSLVVGSLLVIHAHNLHVEKCTKIHNNMSLFALSGPLFRGSQIIVEVLTIWTYLIWHEQHASYQLSKVYELEKKAEVTLGSKPWPTVPTKPCPRC